MYESILVPTDGSEGAEQAVDRAIELATLFNADVHFLRAVDDEQFSTDKPEDNVTAMLDEIESEAEAAVGEYEERALDAGIDYVDSAVRRGVPHEEIVDYAENQDAELTVLGAHGERGYVPGDLGSVAEEVTTRLDEPVLVV